MNNNTKARRLKLTKLQRGRSAEAGNVRKSKHAKVAYGRGR